MKKFILLAAVAATAMSANAQQAVETTGIGDNWSVGLVGGVTTPIENAAFFGDMRGAVGIDINKQISPVFGLGIEGLWGINTSSWTGVKSANVFDSQYVGVYGSLNLNNLILGFDCEKDFFEVEAVAGAGWGLYYYPSGANKAPWGAKDAYTNNWNYFATKAGLNLNFNVCEKVTVSLKPSVMWNMSDAPQWNSSVSYDSHKATVQILAGVTYHFGNGFTCVKPYDQAEVDALNAQINDLRGQLDACNGNVSALNARISALQAELDACNSRPKAVAPQVIDKTGSRMVVLFNQGSAKISNAQKPYVEMVADYLKNNPEAVVVIEGYASPEGSVERNQELSNQRAEAVKNMLVKTYKVDASRIVTCEGKGVGEVFETPSWNRVTICTLEKK